MKFDQAFDRSEQCRLASWTTQSSTTGANRKQRPLVNLIVEPCEVLISAHVTWCLIYSYCINGTKFNFGSTEIKSQAYAPIWHDGPCLPGLQPGPDFFVSGSRFFSVRKKLKCRQYPPIHTNYS